jgi:hypothetical protein
MIMDLIKPLTLSVAFGAFFFALVLHVVLGWGVGVREVECVP